MEIINEFMQMSNITMRGCSTEALLPPHTCMTKDGGGCITHCGVYTDPCSKCSFNPGDFEYSLTDKID